MLILGVDPGASTGIAVFEVPSLQCPLSQVRTLGHVTINRPGASKKNADILARDIAYLDRMALALEDILGENGATHFDITVLEDPCENSRRPNRSAKTDFRLGFYCGIALAALRSRSRSIIRVPVRGSSKQPGWCWHANRFYSTEMALSRTRSDYTRLQGVLPVWETLSDHEKSATGVALWFLRQERGFE